MYELFFSKNKKLTFTFFSSFQTLSSDKCRPMLYDEANASGNCPRLTGIPPHVAILNEMATLKEMISLSSQDLKKTFKEELNNRGIGGERFQANEVLEGVKRIHERMERLVGSGLLSGGGAPVALVAPTTMGPIVADSDVPILVDQGTPDRSTRKMYCWGGMLHNVPENFIIPRMSLHTLIVYWYCGSIQPYCPPLQFAKGHDFIKKSMTQRLSQMRKLMKNVIRAAQKEQFYIRPGGIKTTIQATQLYEAVRKNFEYPAINERIRRHECIGWKTYYNIMTKQKWRFVGDV